MRIRFDAHSPLYLLQQYSEPETDLYLPGLSSAVRNAHSGDGLHSDRGLPVSVPFIALPLFP